MDAIIGRYRAQMEETGLRLRHSSGISFNLTAEETLGLLNFINVHKLTLQRGAEPHTEPRMQKIVIKQEDQQ